MYAVFQATLIHVYNCTSTDANISKEAHDYVHIGKECLTALTRDIPYGPPIIPFLEKLIALLGADSTKRKKEDESDQQQEQQEQPNLSSGNGNTNASSNTATGATTTTTAATAPGSSTMASSNTASAAQQQQQSSNGSPMSVQQIVAEGTEPPAQATWQQLFSSAGTPFTNDSTGFDLQGNVIYSLSRMGIS